MVHDFAALETARQDAAILVESPYFWKAEEYLPLRDYLRASGVLQGEKLD